MNSGDFYKRNPKTDVTKETLKGLTTRIQESLSGRPKYQISPTVRGIKFISDYFDGKVIE